MKIEEEGGDRYSSLEEAQALALRAFVDLIEQVIQKGIQDGRYIVKDGNIHLAEKAEPEKD